MTKLRLSLLPSIYVLFLAVVAQSLFEAFWNVESDRCKKRKQLAISLDQFDIVHNKEQKFNGDKIVMFYEKDFGLFPYYRNYDPTQPVNGGLPQIPDQWFNGLAVIDFEHWRPLFHMNWGNKTVYQDESVKLVRAKYPHMPEVLAVGLAGWEFEKAARNFFLETLEVARDLRPNASWGYYHYPFCNARGNHSDYTCSEEAMNYNNRLAFLYNASGALFPSIYLSGKKPADEAFRYIQAVLNETKRIAQEQKTPLSYYMYTKFEYDPYKKPQWFYNQSDLCNTIKQSADLGANGVVLWSTSTNIRNRCDDIARYVSDSLGPVVLNVTSNLEQCREQMCPGQGTCVLRHPARECSFVFNMSDYECAS